MLPFKRIINQAMLYRIVVDVVQMFIEVILVANDVIPESALPDFTTIHALAIPELVSER